MTDNTTVAGVSPDIIVRLIAARYEIERVGFSTGDVQLLQDAIDEIERLRARQVPATAAGDEWRRAIERARRLVIVRLGDVRDANDEVDRLIGLAIDRLEGGKFPGV